MKNNKKGLTKMIIKQNSNSSYPASNKIYFKSNFGDVCKNAFIPYVEGAYKLSSSNPAELSNSLEHICSMTKQFNKAAVKYELDPDDIPVLTSMSDCLIQLKAGIDNNSSTYGNVKNEINGKMKEIVRSITDTYDCLITYYHNEAGKCVPQNTTKKNQKDIAPHFQILQKKNEKIAKKESPGITSHNLGFDKKNGVKANPSKESEIYTKCYEDLRKALNGRRLFQDPKVKHTKYTNCGNNFSAAVQDIFYPYIKSTNKPVQNTNSIIEKSTREIDKEFTERLDTVHKILEIMNDKLFPVELDGASKKLLDETTEHMINVTNEYVVQKPIRSQIRSKNTELLKYISKTYTDHGITIDPQFNKVIQSEIAQNKSRKPGSSKLT
jgi:hypothetical protein